MVVYQQSTVNKMHGCTVRVYLALLLELLIKALFKEQKILQYNLKLFMIQFNHKNTNFILFFQQHVR